MMAGAKAPTATEFNVVDAKAADSLAPDQLEVLKQPAYKGQTDIAIDDEDEDE
jgi:hypothetical protein